MTDLPNIDLQHLRAISHGYLQVAAPSTDKPRILLLHGSLREVSFSRLMNEEAARVLDALGADTRIFDPRGLPLPDAEDVDHPKVAELRTLCEW